MRYQLGDAATTKLPDLNSCTVRTIVKTTGLSSVIARDIVAYKRKKGRFEHVGELWQLEKMNLPLFEYIAANYTVYKLPQTRKNQNKTKLMTLKSVKGETDIPKRIKRARSQQTKGKQERIPERNSVVQDGSGLFQPSQITMNPVAVTTSASGNALVVTYRAVNSGVDIMDRNNKNASKINHNTGPQRSFKMDSSKRETGVPADAALTMAHVKSAEASQSNPSRLKSIEKWISDVNEAVPSEAKADDRKTTGEITRGSKSLSRNPPSSKDRKIKSSKSHHKKQGVKIAGEQIARGVDPRDEWKGITKKPEYLKSKKTDKDGSRKREQDGTRGTLETNLKKERKVERQVSGDEVGVPGTSGARTEDVKRISRNTVTKQPSKEYNKVSIEKAKSSHSAQQRQKMDGRHRHDRHKHRHRQSGDKMRARKSKDEGVDNEKDPLHQRSIEKHYRSHDKHLRSYDKHHRSRDKHHRSRDNDKWNANRNSSCMLM